MYFQLVVFLFSASVASGIQLQNQLEIESGLFVETYFIQEHPERTDATERWESSTFFIRMDNEPLFIQQDLQMNEEVKVGPTFIQQDLQLNEEVKVGPTFIQQDLQLNEEVKVGPTFIQQDLQLNEEVKVGPTFIQQIGFLQSENN